MKTKRIFRGVLFISGLSLLILGQFVLSHENLASYSGFCIGLGAAFAGLGVGWFIQSLIVSDKQMERIERQKNIELNDERNTRIREKTGYTVAKILNYLLSGYILLITLLGADKTIIFLAIGVLAIEFCLVVYFSNRYSKIL